MPAEQPQTVASVIERYLSLAGGEIAPSTLEMRRPQLPSFSDAHGWRTVAKAKPLHVQEWLKEHPGWGDWTKNGAVRTILAVFGWAVKSKLIASNPFVGACHRAGLPRRNMTAEEFHAILRATRSHRRKRPTPAQVRRVLPPVEGPVDQVDSEHTQRLLPARGGRVAQVSMDDDFGRLFARSGLEPDADPAVPVRGSPVATRCHRVGKGEFRK